MGSFKHHSYFVKEKHVQGVLFPHACLDCRKTFKKPRSVTARLCPECGGQLVVLSRKFSAPKSRDTRQWEKVRFLVINGFLFQPVREGNETVRYPKTLDEAREFVAKYRKQAIPCARKDFDVAILRNEP
ncbi:hypothetical protein [Polaromonas sp. P5_D5]